jgi:diguanylate cyclase (GGDEF)-like protein
VVAISQSVLIAQDIRSLLKSPKLHVKASVGVAQMEPEDTRESLLERADQALYQAKHQGKNKVVIYKQQSQR